MKKYLPALALALVACVILPDLAMAQGGDPFSVGVQWFSAGPARGIAMFGVAAVAVALWFWSSSLRLAGFVLGGGLILANVDQIVGFMGF